MIQLIGDIVETAPLLVVAVEEEARALAPEFSVLFTGVGKVNAAIAVAAALHGPVRPGVLINLGTAGALRNGMSGVHEIGTVVQHDLDDDALEQLTGRRFGAPIPLSGTGPTLATGDAFVADDVLRNKLAQHAALVDMEGYAIAAAARSAGVPVRLVKIVSDDADKSAAPTWQESVNLCARQLAAWAHSNLTEASAPA